MIESANEKEARRQKLEKKLQIRKLSMIEALSEDVAIEWLKAGHPGFMSMLNAKTMLELINYIIIPGPIENKLRSFKLPMVATELLASMNGKLADLFFLEEEPNVCVLTKLIQYFDTTPNYVISGYVVRILMNLMAVNAPRVLELLMKSQPERMLRFLESQSIAQLILRLVIVEDALINMQIKERIGLLNAMIDAYAQNSMPEDCLGRVNWVLCECVIRLWSNKHKELGRFVGCLFRIAETVIDNNNLYQQQQLITVVIRHLSLYQKEAQGMIMTLYKKIYNEFLLNKCNETIRTQGRLTIHRFSQKKYKYLQSLQCIFANCPDVIAKQLTTSNVFSFMLEFITKYEWNSLVLIEVEKILKASILCGIDNIYFGLNRAYFMDKIKELIRSEFMESKFGHGYSGLLKNVVAFLLQNYKSNLPFAQYMKKNHPDNDFIHLIEDFASKRKTQTEFAYKVIHDVAKPFYNFAKLSEVYLGFFEETDAINARLLMESPGKHTPPSKNQIAEIEDEYKLWTQVATDALVEEKKVQAEVE